MKQLCQQLRDGTMEVLDVVLPLSGRGMVVIQNHFSLISAGTDGGTVNAARKSLIGKARDRPEQLKQVIDSVKQQGVVQTYRAVSKKLDSYSSLGYRAHDPRHAERRRRVACWIERENLPPTLRGCTDDGVATMPAWQVAGMHVKSAPTSQSQRQIGAQ